jgi:quinol monooxygenase YgiN
MAVGIRWHAFKIDDTTYGVFDTFASEEGRQEHLGGEMAQKLGEIAGDLLAGAPGLKQVDIIAEK